MSHTLPTPSNQTQPFLIKQIYFSQHTPKLKSLNTYILSSYTPSLHSHTLHHSRSYTRNHAHTHTFLLHSTSHQHPYTIIVSVNCLTFHWLNMPSRTLSSQWYEPVFLLLPLPCLATSQSGQGKVTGFFLLCFWGQQRSQDNALLVFSVSWGVKSSM